MALFTAQIHPGQALEFLVLGASLHDILTRLKAEPLRFPRLDLAYEKSAPVSDAVILGLPGNGIRLRFDGPEQRLRLIEVLDFTKNKLTYKDRDVLRPAKAAQNNSAPSETPSGPTFRHIYNRLLGPTFPGEYIKPEDGDETAMGLYVLSYPGIAFSFPLSEASYSPGKDVVSLLTTAGSQVASSMAIFSGESWPEAREVLYSKALEPLRSYPFFVKARDQVAEEVALVRIFGAGEIELLHRPSNGAHPSSQLIKLGETTPQEIIAYLGPPDAIYRKNDRRMSIHKVRAASGSRNRAEIPDLRLHEDSTDTDQSSAHTATDESEDDDDEGEAAGSVSKECFYNYFYHGFDILISKTTNTSQIPPSRGVPTRPSNDGKIVPLDVSKRLVASKFILHGNVPGSYPFNRHRRCRWEIEYLAKSDRIINSETPFAEIESHLHKEWKSIYENATEAKARQRGMVLNRDWGDSPGSSCELLGGWEEGVEGKRTDLTSASGENGLGSTTLFGFPGLVFEVLKNGIVSGLTVF